MMIPASPWMGSTINPAMFLLFVISVLKESKFPYSTIFILGRYGPKSFLLLSSVLAEMIASVLPWKFPLAKSIMASFCGMPFFK